MQGKLCCLLEVTILAIGGGPDKNHGKTYESLGPIFEGGTPKI
jgi:hypothetical protein